MNETVILPEDNEFSTVNSKKMTELITLIEELVINKSRIEKMKNDLPQAKYSKVLEQEIRLTSQVQEVVKKMRMVEIKTVFAVLPQFITDCCDQHKKYVNIFIEGENTEIENSVVGVISSFLKILIKNLIENDFEVPSIREQSGKDIKSTLKIKASSDSRNILLSIESDGKGFDFENVARTLNRNYIDFVHMNEKEIENLLNLTDCLAGIQDIIAIKSGISMLGGSIELEGEKSKFVRINITIPLSSSITEALLVKVADQVFAIPLEYISTIINKNNVEIKNSFNKELILYMGKAVPLIRIAARLNLPVQDSDSSCIVMVKMNNKEAALLVDSLLDQADVVIKPKPEVLNDIPEFKGTTILGDGNITLVLDILSII